jgi:hypothetical protein
MSRRSLLRAGLGAFVAGSLHGCATAKGDLSPRSGRRVVVVGGGWGGATAAQYVRLGDPTIEVMLLEPNRRFVSCPFSNLVRSGVEPLDALRHSPISRHTTRASGRPTRSARIARRAA